MPRHILVALLLSSLWLCACEKWPPQASNLSDQFLENRAAFESLETKIRATDYVRVTAVGIEGTDRVKFTWKTENPGETGYVFNQKYVEDSDWWNLLHQSSAYSVAHFNDVVTFEFGNSIRVSNKYVFAEYTHSEDELRKRKICKPEYEDLDCGICAVSIVDDWFIDYWWSPVELVPGGYEPVLDNEMTEEEYRTQYDENFKECRINGYTAIGYDLSNPQE